MRLYKHHGLGNDFLILVDLDVSSPISASTAMAVCDRRRGVGADGLIRVTRSDCGGFGMELRNEDGSRAEISGNGLACLTQALVRAGHATGPSILVDTDAGPRTVDVVEACSGTEHRMAVAMGTPVIGAVVDPGEWVDGQIERAVRVDVGNPHVVCHVPDPGSGPDLVDLGEKINAAVPGGANVELITSGGDGHVTMTVYERGVGPTDACGSGAVAAAAAARHWGLVSMSHVTVHQPGGTAEVVLGETARLTVAVVAVAAVDWPL